MLLKFFAVLDVECGVWDLGDEKMANPTSRKYCDANIWQRMDHDLRG